MSEDIYFEIDNRKLYLDFMLECHDFVPLFYVCKDELDARYVVLCTDMVDESYVIVNVSLVDLNDMLSGKIDIRSLFLKQFEFWNVLCLGEDTLGDVVEKCSIDVFPIDCLPSSGEFYVLYDEEHKQYARDIYLELRRRIDNIIVHDMDKTDVDENIPCDIDADIYEEIENVSMTILADNMQCELVYLNENIGLYAA